MFEAKFELASTLKKILDSIKDLVSEVSWDCSSTGIVINTYDNSHVCLVDVVLKSDAFVKYRCDRNVVLGMNLTRLSKIVKCAGNNDAISLQAPDDGDKLTVIIEPTNESEVSQYEFKLMNIQSDRVGIMQVDYPVYIKMPSKNFLRICGRLSEVGETLIISTIKHSVTFTSIGCFASGSTQIRSSTDCNDPTLAVTIYMAEPVTVEMNMKYLNLMAKAAPLSSHVRLYLNPDNAPMMLKYTIKNNDGEKVGHIKFFIASIYDVHAGA